MQGIALLYLLVHTLEIFYYLNYILIDMTNFLRQSKNVSQISSQPWCLSLFIVAVIVDFFFVHEKLLLAYKHFQNTTVHDCSRYLLTTKLFASAESCFPWIEASHHFTSLYFSAFSSCRSAILLSRSVQSRASSLHVWCIS